MKVATQGGKSIVGIVQWTQSWIDLSSISSETEEDRWRTSLKKPEIIY
jgi:hypothetical protein